MSRRVCMFGALRLEQDERPVTLGGKLASLCAYLLLHPQPHPREQLADLLSPDAPPDRSGRGARGQRRRDRGFRCEAPKQ